MEHTDDISQAEGTGSLLLHVAAKTNSHEDVRLLLEDHADVNAVDKNYQTALHIAAEYNSHETAIVLLEHSAEVMAKDVNGWTALHVTARYNTPQTAQVLLKHMQDADISAKSNDHKTALVVAAENESYGILQVLIDKRSHQIDCYQYDETPIGTGMFSSVYRGINRNKGNKEIAVKQVEKSGLNDSEDWTEISNLLLLRNHYLVRYHDVFVGKHLVNIILERMDGTLENLLQERALNDHTYDIEFCKDVMNGLQFLHQQRPPVLHCNIKASNVLYDRSTSTRPQLKIADFGLSTRSRRLAFASTRRWMAPELLRGEEETYSIATDVFASGLVLHAILANQKHPFSPVDVAGKSKYVLDNETIGNMISGQFTIDNSISAEARCMMETMLDKDKNKRPSVYEILRHPYFWTKEMKIQFLNAVGNHPEFGEVAGDVINPLQLQLTVSEYNPTTLPDLVVRVYQTVMEHGWEEQEDIQRAIGPAKTPPILNWTVESQQHKSKLDEVARGNNSITVDKYHFHNEKIGAGVFAVYAGINEEDGREVAVKRMLKDNIKHHEDTREITNLIKLRNCEQVVNYLRCVEDELFVYIILELMEGNLDQYLKHRTDHTRIYDTDMCKDIIQGLDYLHRHNPTVLHRDIKPSNVLYAYKLSRPCLKIADFGLSTRCTSASSTESVHYNIAGTRIWMATELLNCTVQQEHGEYRPKHTKASDVFASGLVLHVILADKKHPFSPRNESAVQLVQHHGTIENLIRHNFTIDEQLSPEAHHMVEEMLHKDVNRRSNTSNVLSHPFFWEKKKKIQFLCEIGNQPEFKRQPLSTTEVESDNDLVTELEYGLGKQFKDTPWISKVPERIYQCMTEPRTKRRQYDITSAVDLVRFVRNTHAHVTEYVADNRITADEIKQVLEEYMFLNNFPTLVTELYKAVRKFGWQEARPEIRIVMEEKC